MLHIMSEADNIKHSIESNYGYILFVIGNGIHRYPDNKSLSWERLLKLGHKNASINI